MIRSKTAVRLRWASLTLAVALAAAASATSGWMTCWAG